MIVLVPQDLRFTAAILLKSAERIISSASGGTYNPLADENGYVYQSNVSEVTEMVEMMAAARSYQNNVEVINTARQLMMRTLDITKA